MNSKSLNIIVSAIAVVFLFGSISLARWGKKAEEGQTLASEKSEDVKKLKAQKKSKKRRVLSEVKSNKAEMKAIKKEEMAREKSLRKKAVARKKLDSEELEEVSEPVEKKKRKNLGSLE